MVLDSIYNSATYNSYLTLVEADDIISSLGPLVSTSKWDSLANTEKESIIAFASQSANKFKYPGVANTAIISPNEMEWPRVGAFYSNGIQIMPTEIPHFIKVYVSKRCLELLTYTPDKENKANFNKNVKSKTVDVIKTEYFSSKESGSAKLKLKDYESFGEIKKYVEANSNSYALGRS